MYDGINVYPRNGKWYWREQAAGEQVEGVGNRYGHEDRDRAVTEACAYAGESGVTVHFHEEDPV